ncbi:MAG: amidohydrolase, partial [bacterium]
MENTLKLNRIIATSLLMAMLGLSTVPNEVTAQSPCCRITTESSTKNTTIEDPPTVKKEESKWQVEGDHGPSTVVEFDSDEGTWMNLDLSPDGNQVVFDLLGDLYTIPITGGQAKLLSGGSAWDMHPRFSPDGKQIAFISDRAGGDNIWLMNADGSNRRALTKETFRLLSSPYWSPDGDWIIARKHFTNTRSLGAG